MKRRINSFLSRLGIHTYEQFLAHIKADSDCYDKFIAYLTINVSEFYRNPLQWVTLEKEVIPYLKMMFGKRLKIWSAACSTGDEPYSLAMVLSELVPDCQLEILATDLDKDVLQRAKKGLYSEKSVVGLPDRYRKKYLIDDGSGVVRVCDKIKDCVRFSEHNLLKDKYEVGFHLIVCRNVLIYFTEEAKDEIYCNFAKSLHKDGILFVGSTEQIIGPEKFGFNSFRSFFYQRL